MKNTKTANVFAFAQDSITANGKTFPAQYSINPAGIVFAFVKVEQDGAQVDVRIKIAPEDPNYPAALKAAQEEREARKQTQAAPDASAACISAAACVPVSAAADPVQADASASVAQEVPAQVPASVETPAAQDTPAPAKAQRKASAKKRAKAAAPVVAEKTAEAVTAPAVVTEAAQEAAPEAEPEQPARDPKQTRGPVPEKAFVGTSLKGKGWKILFDGDHDRTRVIFTRKPSKAAREAVEKAGFYWSPVMESWNKKLTHKAFRAAQALALELRAVCG